MTIYKTFTTLFSLLIVTSVLFGQEVEKTLVKSFNLQGNQVVVLDLEGVVEVKTWSNDIMRVQMTISQKNTSEAILKSLVKAGRYNLKSVVEHDALKVTAPDIQREVKIGGKLLEDTVSYVVFAPENVLVKKAADVSHSSDLTIKGNSL